MAKPHRPGDNSPRPGRRPVGSPVHRTPEFAVPGLVPLTTALPLPHQAYQARADQPPEVRLHGAVLTPADFIPDGTVVLAGDQVRSVGPRRKGKAGGPGVDVD